MTTPITTPSGREPATWTEFLWGLPADVLTRPQRLELMQIVGRSFNNFDGCLVVRDLLRNRDLWQGVVMDRGFPLPPDERTGMTEMHTDLIKLRDIGKGSWNVDTLFVLIVPGTEGRWSAVVEDWSADDVRYIEGRSAGSLLGSFGGPEEKILTVWWD